VGIVKDGHQKNGLIRDAEVHNAHSILLHNPFRRRWTLHQRNGMHQTLYWLLSKSWWCSCNCVGVQMPRKNQKSVILEDTFTSIPNMKMNIGMFNPLIHERWESLKRVATLNMPILFTASGKRRHGSIE
jgi:hypothetical protein